MPSQIEIEFRARSRGVSQNDRLPPISARHLNQWLSDAITSRIITEKGIGAAVHSRVADCRKEFGMTILHREGNMRFWDFQRLNIFTPMDQKLPCLADFSPRADGTWVIKPNLTE